MKHDTSGHGPPPGSASGAAPRPDRRRFLDVLLGTGLFLWLGSILYPVTRYLVPPAHSGPDVASIEAATIDELAPGSYKIFRFGRIPGILVHLRNGSYRALSARCTHLDCTVQFKTDTEQVWCACHNGIYDIEGRNISGPPPKPLERFEVVIKGDRIFVRRGEAI